MRKRIVAAEELARLVEKLADQIVAGDRAGDRLAFVGIKRRGEPLARRLARLLADRGRPGLPVGAIDITLYRDDLQLVAETPIVRGTEIGFDINGLTVVLVDDVIYTGRTTRAALSELLDFGRPAAIRLAVLVDRGNRELPVAPDFTGLVIETGPQDLVDICLSEIDGEDAVYLGRR
ncbi:MAG TPA: bifunctional pyr operon transcriptional regulator/uracil phosphoribosyltransferase PyrR [candidate division WOR-3 bacterium]|uniref:Bifunctional protein PyrR n=1 Tax=candidate division WOR-3 bacterium TaxID=2052148 RepID=A0A7V0T4W9_UNCW3|nr:bifunctional pyr operon transcriptional regulator/uracil phosphoribosyltransferase PyrR [candidate division WOR-3 bacterium]